jgi:5-methylthioribose kinase
LFELTAANASEYLAARGMPRPLAVCELDGGISNTVLMIRMAVDRFVLKQSLPKLRVEEDWFSDPDRNFRESAGIRSLSPHLGPDRLPRVLFEDRENHAFAMSAAPQDAETWKQQLLRGEVRAETADRIGEMLATMLRVSWRNPAWELEFGDQTVFHELRLDPYYRSTAQRNPDLEGHFERLMRESAARRVSIVHGDWSPKNFLVSRDSVMAIDFEVIHYGDPAFDTAFLVNHLVLKSFLQPRYKTEYRAAAIRFLESACAGLPENGRWLKSATLDHLGALMLARVDGKSPVEYLDSHSRAMVRAAARDLILHPARSVEEVFDRK